jgi:hypothetical protein
VNAVRGNDNQDLFGATNSAFQQVFTGVPGRCETDQGRKPGHGKRQRIDCGELPFLIKRDGSWLYRGSPINRKAMVCLFASVLTRDSEGRFILETPAECGLIQVEDAPFVAVELDWTGCGRNQALSFRTSVDQVVVAGPHHRLRVAHDVLTCEPTPYIHLRGGKGSYPIEARINRAVYYELVALAEPGFHRGRRVLGVWSEGVFFPLGDMPCEGSPSCEE